jgi:UTP--glucose-1-phosphate uridylyltransferase
VPKLLEDGFDPVSWPDDRSLEWAPPGHGDVYTSLETSGMLDELLEQGYRYAFLSNSDNLGAVLEPQILDWFARERLPFLSESTKRLEGDRKGGHLARRRADGGLVLRETAQTPDGDMDAFEDVSRHRFFNCNNVWVDLRVLASRDGPLGLPMIVNRKTVDPADPSSPAVVQLETAMGAAIGVFEGAAALRVPRTRFVPVKTTDQLLAVRSDAFAVADDWTLHPAGSEIPLVSLDPDYFKLMNDFEPRFPHGPPSLVECRRLTVEGDVTFGRDVTVRGEATVRANAPGSHLADSEVIEGEVVVG